MYHKRNIDNLENKLEEFVEILEYRVCRSIQLSKYIYEKTDNNLINSLTNFERSFLMRFEGRMRLNKRDM